MKALPQAKRGLLRARRGIEKVSFAVRNARNQLRYARSPDFPHRKYVFIGHHKCATQYIKAVVRDVCLLKGIPASFNRLDWRHIATPREIRCNQFLFIQNYDPDVVDLASFDYRGFRIVRDPRDILISQYYSHKSSHPLSHPLITEDHHALNALDFHEGLEYLITQSRYYKKLIDCMCSWVPQPNVFELTFESLTRSPYEAFSKILDFLGIDIGDQVLRKKLDKFSFSNLRNRIDVTNGVNHYRKGTPGDWKNHLSNELLNAFDKKYGLCLSKLGYTNDV